MKLLVCVLNETQRLNDLLKAMAKLGISGATVLESQGMEKFLAKEAPMVAGLRHLVTQGRTFNYTILSVVEDDEIADRTMKAIEEHLLPGTKPGTRGVAFTLDVDKFVHFHPHGPEVRQAESNGNRAIEPAAKTSASTFERAMLAALKRAEEPGEPSLLARLLNGVRSFSNGGGNSEFKERRRVARVACDYSVTAQIESGSFEVKILDIGLFGLGILSEEQLEVEGQLKLGSPLDHDDEQIECVIRSSQLDAGLYVSRLVYNQSPESLSSSWIASLLRELGYSLAHLSQRRKLRRIQAHLPVELQTFEGDQSVSATALDIGMEGALIESDVDWSQGSQVGLLLGPYEKHEAFYLEGVTVELRASESEGKWLHSVRFFEMDSNRYEKLGRLALELMRRPEAAPST